MSGFQADEDRTRRRKRHERLLLVSLIGAVICLLAVSGTVDAGPSQAASLPVRLGPVNDYARALESRWLLDLEQLSSRIRQENGIEIVVVTVNSNRYGSAQALARELAVAWQVGGDPADGTPGVVVTLDTRQGEFGLGLNDAAAEWFHEPRFRRLFEQEVDPLWAEREFGRGFDRLVRGLAQMMGANDRLR